VQIWRASGETLADDRSAAITIDLCDQVQLKAYYVYGSVDVVWPVNETVTWNNDAGSANTAITSNGGLLTISETTPLNFSVTADVASLPQVTRNINGTNAVAPDSLRIDPSSFSLGINQSKSLVAYANYGGSEKTVTQAASWGFVNSVSNFATLSDNVIKGIAKGVAVVNASCAGLTASASANVAAKEVVYIEVASASIGSDRIIHMNYNNTPGGTQPTADLNVTAHFSDGELQTNWTENIEWHVNGENGINVVSVDANTGIITAQGVGTAVVTATYTGVSPSLTADAFVEVK